MIITEIKGKVRQRTVSRRTAPRPSIWPALRRAVGVLGLMLVVTATSWGAVVTWQILDRPLALIAVKGDFQYASRQQISARVEASLDGGFLSTNLEVIRTELERNPWIESVKIHRQWPDGLVIVVTEEVPIARWNKAGFLTRSGEALEITDNSGLQALPHLTGPVGQAQRVMAQYRHAAQLLLPAGLKTTEFHLDERNAWHLKVTHGLHVEVGQGDVTDKLQRFVAVYQAVLQNREDEVDHIDARYPNGIAVRWRVSDGALGNRI